MITRIPYVILLFISSVAVAGESAHACTTAVISGRATVDGRPLLWKNRDTRVTRHNEVIRLAGGELEAIAVVNAGKKDAVWMGVNEAGFCIENSLTRDLATSGKKSGPGNGGLMKLALETCKTVGDFRVLLEKTDKTGRRTIANFGVIDAQGGAALFETGPKKHVMFDANDPEVAPDGIVVRSNFSTAIRGLPAEPDTAQLTDVFSQGRYRRACTLLNSPDQSKIDIGYVLRACTRDLMDTNLEAIPGSINANAGVLPECIVTSDTISRAITVSATVFHGVRAGEDPRLTTMWTMLGEPIFTLAVPCWVASEEISPELAGDRGAPLGELSNSLRDWNYLPEEEVVRSEALEEVWAELMPVEERIITDTLQLRETLADSTAIETELTRYHRASVSKAYRTLRKVFLNAKSEALANPGSPIPDFSDSLVTSSAAN
ncbi:peptidase C45 [Bremerella sp. JC770]|uniref:peptidase C45 n=1 Tax=Bremerella sp. JC770 TaxID=3232137 RepID=UPI003459FF41